MKACLVLRHVRFEDLGTLTAILERRDFVVRYLEAGIDPIERAEIENADLLIALGGPIGVYDAPTYPFLAQELDAISSRLAAPSPTLGICLGAQLMAKALGATVAPGPAKEIGWAPIELTAAGRRSPLRHLEGLSVLHWHGDNFALPSSCDNLAFTKHCPFQAFRKGASLLALQFHIEIDPGQIEAWLIGHTVELAQARIDPSTIRSATAYHGNALQRTAALIFNEWLDETS
jgi:GMP synthase (glutamine-hydrolysing)